MSETWCLLFFSVAALLVSPVETSDESALIDAPVSIENVSAALSDMRN